MASHKVWKYRPDDVTVEKMHSLLQKLTQKAVKKLQCQNGKTDKMNCPNFGTIQYHN